MATGKGGTAASSPKQGQKVLEGVPKVGYQFSGFQKCTTFSATLESVMNFLGTPMGYEYIMFTSGAAFHQTWRDGWSPGNSDILTMCEDPFEPIHRGMNAVGRGYTIRMCSGADNFGVKARARKSAYVTPARRSMRRPRRRRSSRASIGEFPCWRSASSMCPNGA
jgi:hypothetical protein